MGDRYRTSSSMPLDYMYSINTPLMEKALMANDQAITSNLDMAGQLGTLAHYNYLQGDEEDAKAITAGYVKQIEDVSDAIRKDPANWRKQLDPIRNITKTLKEDYATGAISKHLANFNKRKLDFDNIDKQVDLYHKSGGIKGINPAAAAKMKANLDSKFEKTGYDATTGNYTPYQGGQFMDDIDIRKKLSDGFEKLKADGSIRVREGVAGSQGEYFNKTTEKWEGLTPEKILGLVSDRFKGDTQLQNYLKERSQIGEMNGIYDGDNLIEPYNTGRVNMTPEEQTSISNFQSKIDKTKDTKTKAQLQKQLDDHRATLDKRSRLNWNNQSGLAPILRGIVEQYAYSKSDSENDMSNNSAWNTKFSQAQQNNRQAQSLGQAYRIHKEKEASADDRFKKRLDFDKYKFDHPQPKGTSKTTTITKTSAKTELPQESGVERLATNSFEDWTTKDVKTGQTVPVLSSAGLSSDIITKKGELGTVNIELANVTSKLNNETNPNIKNALKLKQQQLQVKATTLNSELNQRRQYFNVATSKALEDLPVEEQNLYKSLEPGKAVAILTKKIEDARKQHSDIIEKVVGASAGIGGMGGTSFNKAVASLEVKKATEELQRYVQVKKKVDTGKDKILETIRKDYINENAIKMGKEDSDNVGSMILSAPTGLQLYDNQGEPTSGIKVNGKGINWFGANPAKGYHNFTFADGSLTKYIENSGTKMVVQSVAPTTGIGDGHAVAKVRFEDPNGEIPNNKDYYIVMSPELEKQVGNKFKGHKNAEISSIGDNISDDEANNIRRQIAKPNIKEDQKFNILVPDNQGNTLPLNVTKIDNHLNVTFTDKDGNEIPLPSLSGVPGFFNGSAELIKSFKAVKAGTLK